MASAWRGKKVKFNLSEPYVMSKKLEKEQLVSFRLLKQERGELTKEPRVLSYLRRAASQHIGPKPQGPQGEKRGERRMQAVLETCSLSRVRARLKAVVDSMVIRVSDRAAPVPSPAGDCPGALA